MAFDMFLEFPNPAVGTTLPRVQGEVADRWHEKTIALRDVAFGIENTVTIGSASGGAGAGKAKFSSVEITKSVDSASPALFGLVGTGGHFPDAMLYVRRAGATSDYLVYRFKMVFVSEIKWSGANGDDTPEESIKLEFGAMQVNYTPQTSAGIPTAKAISAVWNQVTNSATLDVPTG
jgi:type VI secretion system secreted protein Hcp